MENIKEQDLLRLAMILENQSSTTRDKYICKFAEYVVFDSDKADLSVSEICVAIKEKFQLEFDLSEIEKAIRYKGNGRIININQRYQLSPKAADQISKLPSMADQLNEYVRLYSETIGSDDNKLYSLVVKYIYYCFNSNANNFLNIIGTISKDTLSADEPGLGYSQDEAELINGFLRWENIDKNRLVYSIVASSYEYCLITSNKNPVIPKSIFRNKKFFLDTNIIFRIAGFNNDERRFVTKTFVEKCREVGVSLCYTGAVLKEIYRVIDAHVNYIRCVTKCQPPINASLFSKLYNEYEVNEFYLMYYNWCKERQNNYRDYLSFRNYLLNRINSVIGEFEYYDSSTINLNSKRERDLFDSLYAYKSENKKNKSVKEESVKTDIVQIVQLEGIRPNSAKSLWDTNEFIVSADKLLISWSDLQFDGIPMVVIPSLWLSIILKVAGRATGDDYQSFCMFMTLRQYRTEEDNIQIDPSELLSRLSEKTIDSKIKEQIIAEIINNRYEYSFATIEEYDSSVEKAFDNVLRNNDSLHKEELEKAVAVEKQKALESSIRYEKEISEKRTAEEYAREYAIKKAKKKVDFYSRRENVPLIIEFLSIIVIIIIAVTIVFKLQPLYNWLLSCDSFDERIRSIALWAISSLFSLPISFIRSLWKYLSSEKRRDRLCSKYIRQQLSIMAEETPSFKE